VLEAEFRTIFPDQDDTVVDSIRTASTETSTT